MNQSLWELIGVSKKEINEVGDLIYKGNKQLTFYDIYAELIEHFKGKQREAGLILLGQKITESQFKTGFEKATGEDFDEFIKKRKEDLSL